MTGQYVKERLESADVKLAEVARNLNITPQGLQNRLNVDDMKIGVLTEIARAAGKNIYFFLDGGSMTVQQQTNAKGAKKNSQSGTNQTQTGSFKQPIASSLEGQLDDCMRRLQEKEKNLQEKDQIINDLRRTIALYEQLNRVRTA